MDAGIFSEIERQIVLVHDGEDEVPEYLEKYNVLDLQGKEDLKNALVKKYKIARLPTVLCYGAPVGVEEPEKIKDAEKKRGEEELERVKRKIREEKRVILIKGTPESPQCGYTRQLVGLLADEGLRREEYTAVNVLENDAVREGMKAYADWPTYPQVYIEGEFVGGLDVLRQLKEQNKLEEVLRV